MQAAIPRDPLPKPVLIRRMRAGAAFLLITGFVSAALAQSPQVVVDSQLGYKLTLPAGFAENKLTLPGQNPDIVHTFVRGNLDDQKSITLILITRMRGRLGRESLKPADIPAGSKASTFKAAWRGFHIDAFEVPETEGGVDFLTYNAQVPLRGEAIQIGVFGAASRKAELRSLLDTVLANLEGESNWSDSTANYTPGRVAGRYLGILLFVAIVVVGVVVVSIKSRRTPTRP